MKIVTFIVLLFAMCGIAYADQVCATWDATDPAPDGYRVYVRAIDGEYDYSSPVWVGSETTVTAELPDGDYCAVVRAYNVAGDEIEESGNSNEDCFSLPFAVAPVNFKIQALNKIIEGIEDFKTAIENE